MATPVRVSPLSRLLEPLAAGLWIFFLLWTVGIAVIWSCGLGDGTLTPFIANRDLRAALEWLIGVGDLVWILLAAANTHLWLAETEGLATARRWALTVLGGTAAVAALSVWTGFPLGAIRYSAPLGVKLGPVPLGLPLLWFALVIGARQTVLRVWPGAGQAQLAVGVGVLALLADFNLEAVAAKIRGFWFWSAPTPFTPPLFTPPWTNYAAWAVAAAALTFTLREERVAAGTRVSGVRPLLIFGLLNGVFLAAHLGRWLRG